MLGGKPVLTEDTLARLKGLPEEADALLTLKQVAAILGVSVQTARNLTEGGHLRYVPLPTRTGREDKRARRIRKSDVRAFIERHLTKEGA